MAGLHIRISDIRAIYVEYRSSIRDIRSLYPSMIIVLLITPIMRISLEYLSYEKFKTEYSKLYGKTMFAIYATVLTPITQKKKLTIYREIGYCVLYSYS